MNPLIICNVTVPMELNVFTKEYVGMLKLSKLTPRFNGNEFGIDGGVFCYISKPETSDKLVAVWKYKGQENVVGPESIDKFIPLLESKIVELI